MFNKFNDKMSKKLIAKTIINDAMDFVELFFNEDKYSQKYISRRYFDKHGEEEKQDFRRYIHENVSRIMENENYFLGMRRALIECSKVERINRLIFDDEFAENRHLIYDSFNNDVKDDNDRWSDERCGHLSIVYEAECIILRLLQFAHFEDVSKKDWWENYVKALESHFRLLFGSIINGLSDADRLLIKKSWEMIDHAENVILGKQISDI
jgi:hypothetical protein